MYTWLWLSPALLSSHPFLVQQDIIHPNICLHTAKPTGLWTRSCSWIIPSCPVFQIKGSALRVGLIQLCPISAQSHLKDWDNLNAACETSLYKGPSVPRGPGHWSLNIKTAVSALPGFVLTCFLATPFIHCSGRPEAQLASLNVTCLASSGVWSCGVERVVQSSVARLDGAGLYKPRDQLGTYPLSVGCATSLPWHGALVTPCVLSSIPYRVSHSGTKAVQGIFMLSEKKSSFCYCGSERFFQHLAALWLLASISACCLLPLSSSRSTACMAWGQPLTSVTLV